MQRECRDSEATSPGWIRGCLLESREYIKWKARMGLECGGLRTLVLVLEPIGKATTEL